MQLYAQCGPETLLTHRIPGLQQRVSVRSEVVFHGLLTVCLRSVPLLLLVATMDKIESDPRYKNFPLPELDRVLRIYDLLG